MLAIAAYYDYEIWQMDIKTAFLNGFLKEELYMMHPEGFVDPKNANKVCKLQRSIYGLVQASRSWNVRFDEMIKAFGFYADLWRNDGGPGFRRMARGHKIREDPCMKTKYGL